jgi:antitoxin component YwqK of YwqJK toxin-antitoxin module
MRLPYFFFLALLFSCAQNEPNKQVIRTTYDNGKPQDIEVYTQAGEKIGELKMYKDGKPYVNIAFDDGKKNGVARSWRNDGKPWSLNTYKDDILNGTYKIWHPNGQMMISGCYKMGLRDSIWETYDDQGILIQKIDYTTLPDSLRKE